MDNKLFVLIGNIGSGKSTFAKNFVKNYPKKIVCIQRDALRDMIGCGDYLFDPELEPAIWDSNLETVKIFMSLGRDIGIDIIVDEVNVSREYRKAYLEWADVFGYQKIALVLPILNKETCVSQRLETNHGDTPKEVWEGVWDKFESVYQTPTLEEGFDEIRTACTGCMGSGKRAAWDGPDHFDIVKCSDCSGKGYKIGVG